ncbi:MAG TPA: DNA cytosine methyltransferase [Cyanobacteria bacterium UBA11149]|nr:DNA cytosine methyltransferase [Cyanobacteria bacterium UBA11166]HBR75243.1 DNA cytosine methyltransferase [Cyanobacteria bacterium UBA11159]HBS70515.1 DNA cytosine methyltransferase [Cyanobacteria bacterium UBA11153]HBW89659.1 DNA cytosine methyltransferase [Cyanobacteria bacterium UBA11149]HCA96807.1 DNA cytosine methyltransferase [Cyanobacteria bacterium UBA9226]
MSIIVEIPLQVASFFSGIGGFDLGFEMAGMKVVMQCEIDAFCRKVLQKHWPDVPLYSDITEISVEEIPDSDIYVAGFPCQDLSLANQGKRKGLDGERSGLFHEFIRIVAERKPRWIVLENVPGLLNSNSGRDFTEVLNRLDRCGYGVSWRVFDSKFFGTPQRRRRVFLVGSFGSICSAKILLDDRAFAVSSRESKCQKQTTTTRFRNSDKKSNLYSIQHASIGRKHTAGPQSKGFRNDGETWTLDSRGSSDVVCQTDDSFGVRETSGISGRLDSRRFRVLGNAVTVYVAKYIAERIINLEKGHQLVAETPRPIFKQLALF